MADSALNRYLMSGTTTQRLAFTPVPQVAASGPVLTPYWFDTTLNQLFVWIGAAWVPLPAGGSSEPREGSVTKPLVAAFTPVNFAGTTASSNGVTGIILTDSVAATAFRLLEQTAAIPATPWSIYGRFDYQPQAAGQGGLTLRNSGTGKLIFWGRYQGGLLQTNWTNVNAFSSNPYGPVNAALGQLTPKWWRIDNDGVNLKFWYSPDGRDWFTEANLNPTLAAFIGSVDRVGFGIETDGASATDQTWIRCSSFSFVAPT